MTDSVFISALSCFFPAVILSLFVLPLLLHFPTFIPHSARLCSDAAWQPLPLGEVLLIPTDIRGTENGKTGQNQQTRRQLVLRFVSILTLSLHPFFFFLTFINFLMKLRLRRWQLITWSLTPKFTIISQLVQKDRTWSKHSPIRHY